LHRCLRRHGISRLPEVEGEATPKRKFKAYPIGYFHIDIAEVRTAEGKLYLLVAIDRTSKFAFVELRETVSRRDAADFLRRLIEAVPYKVHTVLTDNGTHFTDPAGDSWSPVEIREMKALPSACLRICLRPQRYRPQADEAEASMDEWSGRANEPDD
jgi:transposase-like protein